MFRRIVLIIVFVFTALTAHATDIEALYAQLSAKPSAATANQLIEALYAQGQADSLYVFTTDSDPHIMLYVSKSMSYYYFDNGDYRRSIQLSEQALRYADERHDVEDIIDNYVQMSSSYISLSDYQTAIKVNMKAIEYAEANGAVNRLGTAYAYHNLATCYHSLRKEDAAWKYIQKSIDIEEALGNDEGLSASYGMASEILQAMKRNDDALDYIHRSIALAEKQGQVQHAASHHTQAVDIFIKQGRMKEAEEECLKALAYFESSEPRLETIICYKQYGQILVAKDNCPKAREYFKRAEALAVQLDNQHQLLIIYEELALLELASNPALAFQYLQRRDALKDSIFSEETNRLVSDAEVRYETAQKEVQIQEQQNQLKTRLVWLVASIATAVVVILLIIVYISVATGRKNRRHADELKVERDNAEAQRQAAEEQRAIAEQQRSLAEEHKAVAEEQRAIAEGLRVEAEEERNKAVLLSEMKTTFINNLTHEVRTPLNSILGFNDLLNGSGMEFSEEERRDMVGQINGMVHRLTTLLDKVIYMSRLDGKDIQPEMAEFPLAELIAEAFAASADKARPEVAFDIEAALMTELVVTTDHDLFIEALSAVLDNAVKFTEQGSITLSVESIAPSVTNPTTAQPYNPITPQPHNPTTQISVTSTSDPIAPENAELVFERFEKLGRFDAGFGLGLSIARETLALIGGTIHLDTACTDAVRFIIKV